MASTIRRLTKAVAAVTRPRLRKGVVSPLLEVPSKIQKPPYYFRRNSSTMPLIQESNNIPILSEEEQKKMRESCRIASSVLEFACSLVKPGITTDEIDKIVTEEIFRHEAYPSPLHYHGFPKSICTSVNECACHGIPDNRALVEGDLISIDVTVYKNGFHGDTCKTVIVGEPKNPDALNKLIEVSYEATWTGIKSCGPNVSFRAIGDSIENFVKEEGMDVIPDFVGHGVGKDFHSMPTVHHTKNDSHDLMKPGMTFTIEPLVCEGSPEVAMWNDMWTVTTLDRSLVSQFEHTILITETGFDVLTFREEETAFGHQPSYKNN
eukprot:TRINITY_DN12394_c0_g1_i1.p1 TRINITY_DN12394_c0_g1~~TRINITY_DN12394_c0_g1_i1.p1  ORF type:complete len:331 (+),score=87.58 TRINITY_DN12394_c0_g1_i1:31-993(+)